MKLFSAMYRRNGRLRSSSHRDCISLPTESTWARPPAPPCALPPDWPLTSAPPLPSAAGATGEGAAARRPVWTRVALSGRVKGSDTCATAAMAGTERRRRAEMRPETAARCSGGGAAVPRPRASRTTGTGSRPGVRACASASAQRRDGRRFAMDAEVHVRVREWS
eukprot:scaffold27448_cov83-Isochrysis_galbana.AAC.1